MAAPDVIARQVALYGEPLADRFARLLAAYGIPQSRLAATIGLSAPMLSQLASGHRVKISNPAVLARLLRLEELAGDAAIRAGNPARIADALREVAGSHPTLHTGALHTVAVADHGALVAGLAAAGTSTELDAAAAAVTGSALGALLHEAARERHA